MNYGMSPKKVKSIKLSPSEYVYCVYLPIKMPYSVWAIPKNLHWCLPMIEQCVFDYGDLSGKYVYLTAKYLFVSGYSGNRSGWHSDGFMTGDVNYIWSDNNPTEFCVQPYELSMNHEKSLIEMQEQSKDENIRTYKPNTILMLDQNCIHRIPFCSDGLRAFVKLSVSEEFYNLKGNAINYDFEYDYPSEERTEQRNNPVKI